MAIFGGGFPNLKGIKYFNLSFCHNHLLTKPNIYAKFERNRWCELYRLLPGFLMDAILTSCSAEKDKLFPVIHFSFYTVTTPQKFY